MIVLLVLIGSAWLRRIDLALLSLPALAMVAAYALFSPFFPRYGLPMHLMTIVLLVITATLLWKAVAGRMSSGVEAAAPFKYPPPVT